MSTIKTKNIKQTVISGTTQPLKIGGIAEDGSDAKISIGSDGSVNVLRQSTSTGTTVNYIWSGTQAQYDAIGTKDDNTVYLIV